MLDIKTLVQFKVLQPLNKNYTWVQIRIITKKVLISVKNSYIVSEVKKRK